MSNKKASKWNFLSSIFGSAEALAAEEETEDVKWAMVIDLEKCIGCDTCTVSCKAENRTPPGISYNNVLTKEVGSYPFVSKEHCPTPCMQCDDAPCEDVCPVGATYQLDNGIVAINYERCIGCRYCMAACPYGVRYFDFGESYNQEMVAYDKFQGHEYGQPAPIRKGKQSPIGTVRKCHFCYHRLERGQEPACVETCIGDARYFGDLNNKGSLVSRLVASGRAQRLREELGTEARVYYLK